MKIAILIAHAEVEPFESIRSEIHPLIYEKAKEYGLDIFYAVGRNKSTFFRIKFNTYMERLRHSHFYLISRLYDFLILNLYRFFSVKYSVTGNIIRVNVPEDLRHLGQKILISFEYLLEQGYEWIYRTTSSSVVNIPLLVQEINELKVAENSIVAGTVAHRAKSHDFVVGSNLLLNKSALVWIIKNKNKWDHSLMDDVALGRLFRGAIDFKSLPSQSFSELSQISKCDIEELKRTIQFRCKTSTIPRSDSEIMRAIYQLIR